MSATSLLSVRDLTVTYSLGGKVGRAADGLNFDIQPGERLGIVGESGSGKSTLALALMRLHRPPARIEGGTAMLDGTDIMKLEGEALRQFRWKKIALIPQGAMNSLNPVLTVGKQLADAIADHEGRLPKREVIERIEVALQSVGLPATARHLFPHELSGGMKQRACIALAIILKPRLIIADEPTSALDVVVQRKVIETLKRVQDEIGAGLIMIGHDMGLMAQAVDRLAVMYAGRMVDIAPIRDFFRRPLHPYSRALIASLPDLDQKREVFGIPGAQPPLFDLPSGCAFNPRCPLRIDRCVREVPPLTEVEPGRAAACHVVTQTEAA
jgi:peptide/nickel transport system ATP-binding protein